MVIELRTLAVDFGVDVSFGFVGYRSRAGRVIVNVFESLNSEHRKYEVEHGHGHGHGHGCERGCGRGSGK